MAFQHLLHWWLKTHALWGCFLLKVDPQNDPSDPMDINLNGQLPNKNQGAGNEGQNAIIKLVKYFKKTLQHYLS